MNHTNIFCLNTHLFEGTFVGKIYKPILYHDNTRMKTICKYLKHNNFDLVMLSEVWSDEMKLKIANKLGNIYPYVWIPPHTSTCFKTGPEFLFLSKNPMSDKCFTNFTSLSGWDSMSEKKICGMVMNNIFYCCTHLDTTDTCQVSNIAQIINFININKNNHPVVLAGDFNINEYNPNDFAHTTGQYDFLRNTLGNIGLIDAGRIVQPNALIHPFYTTDNLNNITDNNFSPNCFTQSRIDYYFTQGILPVQYSTVPSTMSDHYGIKMTFVVN